MMKLRKSYIFILLLCCFGFWAGAQKTIQPKGLEYEYKGIVYNTERAYELTLHTNGFSAAVDFGKLRTYYKTFYYHLGLGYISHPLEERQNKNQPFDGLVSSKSFRYGKQNYFYLLRAGVGNKIYKSEKTKRRGIAVGWNYEIGPVIVILRPVKNIYLVDLNSTGIKMPVEITYADDPELFMDLPSIFGRSTDLSTFLDSTIRPGIQAKAGAHFSLGAFDKYVRAFEVGLMVDYFGVKIPIMVENEFHSNSPIFINIYATFLFGSRE